MGMFLLAGCSQTATSQTAEEPDEQTDVQTDQNDQVETMDTVIRDTVVEGNGDQGERIPITLEEAAIKKNSDVQFVLLYTKDDCSYCAQFDEVLDPYLETHPLKVYEVSLSEAEEMYSEDDRNTLLNILTAGVSKTPALYFIESQTDISMLDHTESNYSLEGLEQFVESHDLLAGSLDDAIPAGG